MLDAYGTLRITHIILNMKTRTSSACDKKRTTISLSSDLLAQGEQRAREARRSFSNYIEVLIAADEKIERDLKQKAKLPA
jgi:hypothetical protein